MPAEVSDAALLTSVEDGHRITVMANAGAPYRAEGYVLMFDQRDLMLLLLKDNGQAVDEPVIVLVHRPLLAVIHLHAESTYASEPQSLRDLADPIISVLREQYGPVA